MYYVIQVANSKEEKTIREIKESELINFIDDVFVPKYAEPKKFKDTWKEVTKICFPGYIFIETSNINEVFKRLPNLPAFTRLLGREKNTDNFIPLNDIESRMIDILYNKENRHLADLSTVEFKEGSKAVILSGPLLGQESTIKKIDKHKRIATLSIVFAGRLCDVKLGLEFISPK